MKKIRLISEFELKSQSQLRMHFVMLILLMSFLTTSQTFGMSHHGVHPLPNKGPWFEGWYIRITDSQSDSSYALIVASQTHKQELIKNKKSLPGYLAVLKQEQNTKTESFESFPQETTILNNGLPFDFTQGGQNENFQWQATNQGWLTSEGFHLLIPGKIELKGKIKNRKAWDPYSSEWGPEGYGTFLKFIPLHWFVYSLGSEIEYTVKLFNSDGTFTEKTSIGVAHIEKNWGKVFPEAWMWVQGYDAKTESSLALAGGILRLAQIPIKTYLVGFRSLKVEAYFQLGQMFDFEFQDVIDPCRGEFKIRMTNGEHIMILKAKADPKSFASVSIPTKNGYETRGGIESFTTDIDVEIHNNNWVKDFVSVSSLIEKVKFKKAALEFGAAFMDQSKCPR